MVCDSSYTPTWRPQLNADDPYGGLNCTAYVAGYAIDYATCGAKKPTGKTIRRQSSEPVPDPSSPGLNLEQVASVASRYYGVELSIYKGLAFDTWAQKVSAGRYSILSVDYEPIRVSRFAGSTTFSDGHALGVPPGFEVQDPLADGRRAGIYRYHKEPYPLAMLKRAAELLIIGYVNGRPVRVIDKYGPGRVWCAFTIAHLDVDDDPGPTVVPNWPAPSEKNTMIAEGGLTVTSNYRKDLAKDQPLFRWPGGPVGAKMSRASSVPYMGTAGSGWHAIQVLTGQPYGDKVARPTILYVPASAGPIHK